MQKTSANSDSLNSEQTACLERKLAEFAAGIGHELNNPLASIGGRVQLLMKTAANEQLRRDLADIYSEVKRAGDLIADIRLYACPPQPVWESVNIAHVLQKTLDFYSPQCVGKNIHLKLELPSGADNLTIEADESQMHVLFSAIVRNAFEALENDSREFEKNILVSATALPETVTVSVSDNGPGLTDVESEHAFDPYFSGRQANRGLGFGLCKAKRIVQMHGGTIAIESTLKAGTRVVVELPIKKDAVK